VTRFRQRVSGNNTRTLAHGRGHDATKRVGEAVSRRAHNPETVSASLTPAILVVLPGLLMPALVTVISAGF
jgi:hypothetical protein